MNLADQFSADATAAGAQQQAPLTIAQQFAADAAAGAKAQVVQAKAQAQQTATTNAQAQDFAAGGASPDTLSQLGQIATSGAHGIGSMFNNAANFVERNLPFFPADIAARDTAAQAMSDQQFAQNASPGEKATAFLAPMFLPMSGAMAPGNALKAGITSLPRMGGTIGKAVGSVAGNALNGGLMATGTPIDPNQPASSVGSQDLSHLLIGAGLGAGIPGAISAGRAFGSSVYNAAAPILNPQRYVGQQFASQLGDQAGDIANSIRTAPQFVPNSMPTTAQAGANPTLVATEKALANTSPDFKVALANRGIANNDARWSALMGVAQTPEALQAAQTARGDATFPLYSQAGDQTANAGKALVNLFQRPAMRQAAQQADQLAANRGETLVWPQQGGDMSINGRALDYTNRALGDMIGSAKASGNSELAAGLADAQSQLQGWTNRYIPAQRQASKVYAQMSVPVNTMEVGQQIANGLGTRGMNAGGVPQIGLMPFRSALTSAMNGAKYGVDADALNTLQGIGQDLQRETVSNGLRSPGSDTAYNVAANGWLARNLYGNNFGGATGVGRAIGALGALATGHPMVGLGILGGGAKLGQMVGNKLNPELSNFLLNPSELLPYLDARAAGPVNAAQNPLGGLLQRNVLPAAIGGVGRGGLMYSQ